jgi:RNA polymerase sigma-70 factor (ECF subfamily)
MGEVGTEVLKKLRRELDNTDDKTLLRRAQKNDLDALHTIHHRYFTPLYNYALYRVNDPMAAEDITSEVFTRLLEVVQGSAKQPHALRKWLFGVAHNVVADFLRYHYRNGTVDLLEDQPVLSTEKDNPVFILESRLQLATLRTALTKLTDEQREVIALRFGAEMSVKSTAQTMCKSVGAVKVLQFRALKALKAQLET